MEISRKKFPLNKSTSRRKNSHFIKLQAWKFDKDILSKRFSKNNKSRTLFNERWQFGKKSSTIFCVEHLYESNIPIMKQTLSLFVKSHTKKKISHSNKNFHKLSRVLWKNREKKVHCENVSTHDPLKMRKMSHSAEVADIGFAAMISWVPGPAWRGGKWKSMVEMWTLDKRACGSRACTSTRTSCAGLPAVREECPCAAGIASTPEIQRITRTSPPSSRARRDCRGQSRNRSGRRSFKLWGARASTGVTGYNRPRPPLSRGGGFPSGESGVDRKIGKSWGFFQGGTSTKPLWTRFLCNFTYHHIPSHGINDVHAKNQSFYNTVLE